MAAVHWGKEPVRVPVSVINSNGHLRKETGMPLKGHFVIMYGSFTGLLHY